MQLGKEFGLEGEKLLEFVREQEEKEEKADQKNVKKNAERKKKKRNADS